MGALQLQQPGDGIDEQRENDRVESKRENAVDQSYTSQAA